MEFYTTNGRRSDAFKGTIRDIMKSRRRLVVRKFAYVTKVLFHANTAIGVRGDRHGKMFEARARNEVILSAGAIHTPKILLLSGIGPREDLEKLGVNG